MKQLAQSFQFPGATKEQLADVLATAPLVGEVSIFGNRTVKSTSTDQGVRTAVGFEPVPIPLLRFDVNIHQQAVDTGPLVILEFNQPQSKRPYLTGQFAWFLEDGRETTALLREEINTTSALAVVERPLGGSTASIRRWLFFSGGHQRLMNDVANNLRTLLGAQANESS